MSSVSLAAGVAVPLGPGPLLLAAAAAAIEPSSLFVGVARCPLPRCPRPALGCLRLLPVAPLPAGPRACARGKGGGGPRAFSKGGSGRGGRGGGEGRRGSLPPPSPALRAPSTTTSIGKAAGGRRPRRPLRGWRAAGNNRAALVWWDESTEGRPREALSRAEAGVPPVAGSLEELRKEGDDDCPPASSRVGGENPGRRHFLVWSCPVLILKVRRKLRWTEVKRV